MQNIEEKKNVELNGVSKPFWVKGAAAVLVIAAALCGYSVMKVGAGEERLEQEGAMPAVSVKTVEKADISSQPSEYVGRVEAIQSVQVRPQISGEIQRVCFKEGSVVREGAVLFQIDPAPYQATVALRRAELERAMATLDEAERYYARVSAADTRAVSAADRDKAESSLLQGRAAVSQAKASLSLAEIDLGYCRVTAPITGKTGAANFTKGNYVTPQSGPLASIVQMDPIRVSYTLPDRDYLDQLESFKKQGPVHKTRLVLSNGSAFDKPGERDFEENTVDSQTGTIQMRLRYANKEGLLIPGEMIRVFTKPVTSRRVNVIPQVAVMADDKGDYVYVIEKDGSVRQARVTLGREMGQLREAEGLTEGQMVAVASLQSLRPGMRVKVDAPAVPERSGAPRPASGGGKETE